MLGDAKAAEWRDGCRQVWSNTLRRGATLPEYANDAEDPKQSEGGFEARVLRVMVRVRVRANRASYAALHAAAMAMAQTWE